MPRPGPSGVQIADRPSPRPTQLVLLSGGIDSAAALALTAESGSPTSALFVDYGQASAASEAQASASIAAYYSVPLRTLRCSGIAFGQGEIRGRNAFLVHAGLMVFPDNAGVVVLGIHDGTGYRDCSSEFASLVQGSFDFHTGGRIALATPFIDHFKGDVFNIAVKLGVPLDLTYSCEAGVTPCGECLSCRDREILFART